ncbi:MAG: electron transfer flavoprotein subunit beta/FixA family protein [bacterium]
MNILVCLSRVPDTATKIIIGTDRKSIDETGVKYIINPYDEFAIESALQLVEINGGSVTAVTVGGENAQDVLRTALAMGVENAVIIKADKYVDSFFVAENLAKYAKTMNPDLIFLGRQSVDFDSFQMASTLSELLGIPSVSVVSKFEINGNTVTCSRDIEGGKEILEASMPCIISAQKGLNSPRYPKLPDIMKAKKKPIDIIENFGGSNRVDLVDMQLPQKERQGIILSDSDADIDEFIRLLREQAKVI